jgi:dihydropteroate synthase
VGVSRKNFVRKIAGSGENELLFGTAAAVTWALSRGASIVRVHDPESIAPVVRMAAALAKTVVSSTRSLPGAGTKTKTGGSVVGRLEG